MVVTMQETFAGIRVDRIGRTRRSPAEILFAEATILQFRSNALDQGDRKRSGPIVETIAAFSVCLAVLYVYYARIHPAKFYRADRRDIHSLRAGQDTKPNSHRDAAIDLSRPTEIFAIIDTKRDGSEMRPEAIMLPPSQGDLELDKVSFRYLSGVDGCDKGLRSARF